MKASGASDSVATLIFEAFFLAVFALSTWAGCTDNSNAFFLRSNVPTPSSAPFSASSSDRPPPLPAPAPQASSGPLVSLAPSITETLLAISPDLAPRIVGVTAFDDAPEVKHAAKVGGYGAPSLEAVLALSPALVLAEDIPATRHQLDELRTLGLSVATFPLGNTSDILSSVEKIGGAVGKADSGKVASARLAHRLKNIGHIRDEQRPTHHPTPYAVLVVGWEPLVVAGPQSYPSEILAIAGANNAVKDTSVAYPVLTPESLLSMAPDVIVDASSHGQTSEKSTVLKLLQRGQSLRIIEVSDAILRPGPRIADAAEELWKKLHESTRR